jgi:hypothetical protein
MFDCSKDVIAHHDEKVTLPQAERTTMRERRNANRERLKRGLKNAGKAAPHEFVSQGSYGMKTMTQHPESDYDIDDGVYFDKDALVGPRGAEMSALQGRQFVRDAVDDGSFSRPPEVRNNCVRVYYVAGYHVDMPVYRRVTYRDARGDLYYYYELASTDWKRSDARDVTEWFEEQNNTQSPDTINGRQLRRIVREIKKFARSRESWKGQILSGFGITKLVTECYCGNASREDISLHDTMRAIRDRLDWSLEINHPVTPNETITKDAKDARARYLRDRLTEAINTLAPLFESDCTRAKALKYWYRVFATTFFSDRSETTAKAAPSLLRAPSVGAPAAPFTFPNAPRVDDKPRGFGSCGG